MTTLRTTETHDTREHILAHGQRIMAGKGFSAVGINEVLAAAGVPKGSFYHYFGSKDAFGEALLESYFDEYLAELDAILSAPGSNMARRLMNYWEFWKNNQLFYECQGKCLAVKLAAEVADLSEPMRRVLMRGTTGIIERVARAIEAGIAEGSLSISGTPQEVAENLYQLWLGASVMVKIVRTPRPFENALVVTHDILHISA